MNVRGLKGDDKIGSINDLVLGQDGRIEYVAVSFGGFLGMGDKLFAVPFEAIDFVKTDSDAYARIDATEETLKQKQGFNQDKWPSEADRSFTSGKLRQQASAEHFSIAAYSTVCLAYTGRCSHTNCEGRTIRARSRPTFCRRGHRPVYFSLGCGRKPMSTRPCPRIAKFEGLLRIGSPVRLSCMGPRKTGPHFFVAPIIHSGDRGGLSVEFISESNRV